MISVKFFMNIDKCLTSHITITVFISSVRARAPSNFKTLSCPIFVVMHITIINKWFRLLSCSESRVGSVFRNTDTRISLALNHSFSSYQLSAAGQSQFQFSHLWNGDQNSPHHIGAMKSWVENGYPWTCHLVPVKGEWPWQAWTKATLPAGGLHLP